MAQSQKDLQNKLEELLGSKNVYYQPPETIKMNYPAIRYVKSNFSTRYANNHIYSKMTRYEIIVIAKRPDDPVIDKLMELPYCSYDRHYISENLHHDTLTLYF